MDFGSCWGQGRVCLLFLPSCGSGACFEAEAIVSSFKDVAAVGALQVERTMGLGSNGLVWEPIGVLGRTMTDGERENVSQRLETQSARAHVLLEPHRDTLERIAQALINQGHLSGDEVGRMLPEVDASGGENGNEQAGLPGPHRHDPDTMWGEVFVPPHLPAEPGVAQSATNA